MLVSLHVKDLALIEETEVWFGDGLNILTGETGAGKSMIIGSILLALGGRADRDLIRSGAQQALVELTFQVGGETRRKLEAMELPVGEDGEVILSRRIQPARSVCRMNGETVSLRQMQELAEVLADLSGQHENQTLLSRRRHLEILDAYAAERLSGLKERLHGQYRIWQQAGAELEEDEGGEARRERELALLRFELDEIEGAALREGEDEELEADYRRMRSAGRLAETATNVYHMTGYDGPQGAGETIGRAIRELSAVTALDGAAEALAGQLTQIDGLLNDFNRELSDYLSGLEFDEQDFQETEQRLNLWNRMKEKYGGSYEAICKSRREREETCEKLANYAARRERLLREREEAARELEALCQDVHRVRLAAAEELAGKMRETLADLNFPNVRFEIAVSEAEHMTREGKDDVVFLLSANPGEELRGLDQIASGGELSRILLALKTVLSGQDEVETLIFDEIDAGISGRTAWQVAQKLAALGRTRQVICITHLPQIAAMADTHFVIEKTAGDGSTVTEIRKLAGEEEELSEVSRLLGGGAVTEAALDNARELKRQAREAKRSRS